MDENSERKDPLLPEEAGSLPAPEGRPRWPYGIVGLVRVSLSVLTIVILMLWVLGAFRHDVIQAVERPIPDEQHSNLPAETLTMRTYPASTEAVGTVQAEKVASVSARLVANIVEVRVSAGQKINSGEVLVVLDDRDLRHRVEQAQDAVDAAQAILAQAQSDFTRDKPLFDQQVITPYDFQSTETKLRTAEASLHRLEEVGKEARINLSYAVIRSPFAGVVIDTLADVGDLAAPGRPLLTMYQHDRLWLEAAVPEGVVGRIHLNEVLPLRIDTRNREMTGPVVQVVPSSDPSTRTVLVRVHLSQTKDLVPGMFGRLLIPAEPEKMLTVPASALLRVGQLTMVEAVRGGRVERRTVTLGRAIDNRYEVLSGLRAGESVVLQPIPAESLAEKR